mmetsp:Transcript_12321/g.53014  ORF Transcript_12321/g.53014 Transcript_12321/m.53014 type:complete len:239 (-) Transcript_12321:694-1410(-)
MELLPETIASCSSATARHTGEVSALPTRLSSRDVTGAAYGLSMSSPGGGSTGLNLVRLSGEVSFQSPTGMNVFPVPAGPTPVASASFAAVVAYSAAGTAASSRPIGAESIASMARSSPGRLGSGVGSSTPHRSRSQNHSAASGKVSASSSDPARARACASGRRSTVSVAAWSHSAHMIVSGWSAPHPKTQAPCARLRRSTAKSLYPSCSKTAPRLRTRSAMAGECAPSATVPREMART